MTSLNNSMFLSYTSYLVRNGFFFIFLTLSGNVIKCLLTEFVPARGENIRFS